jgi:hypothetical protein
MGELAFFGTLCYDEGETFGKDGTINLKTREHQWRERVLE